MRHGNGQDLPEKNLIFIYFCFLRVAPFVFTFLHSNQPAMGNNTMPSSSSTLAGQQRLFWCLFVRSSDAGNIAPLRNGILLLFISNIAGRREDLFLLSACLPFVIRQPPPVQERPLCLLLTSRLFHCLLSPPDFGYSFICKRSPCSRETQSTTTTTTWTTNNKQRALSLNWLIYCTAVIHFSGGR